MNQPVAIGQLLAAIDWGQAEFASAFAALSDEQLTAPGAENEWSIKDILAHISFWHRRLAYMLGCLARGEAFERLSQAGEDANAAIDRVNTENAAANQDRSLAEVRAEYARSFEQALAAVAQLRDEDLAPGSRLSAALGGSLLELVAGDTYGHYAEHLASIRAWLAKTA